MDQPLNKEQTLVTDLFGTPLYLKVRSCYVHNVDEMKTSDPEKGKNEFKAKHSIVGLLGAKTAVSIEPPRNDRWLTVEKADTGRGAAIFNPDWQFSDMGIGGLNDEFSSLFRRAFASRLFPPKVIQQLGIKHVKGIFNKF